MNTFQLNKFFLLSHGPHLNLSSKPGFLKVSLCIFSSHVTFKPTDIQFPPHKDTEVALAWGIQDLLDSKHEVHIQLISSHIPGALDSLSKPSSLLTSSTSSDITSMAIHSQTSSQASIPLLVT